MRLVHQIEKRNYLKKLDALGIAYFKNNEDMMVNEIEQLDRLRQKVKKSKANTLFETKRSSASSERP